MRATSSSPSSCTSAGVIFVVVCSRKRVGVEFVAVGNFQTPSSVVVFGSSFVK